MFRNLRVIATGQWCGPAGEDARFPDDGHVWADAVAATLGLAPGSLEVVDSDADQRTGALVEDPHVTPPPPVIPPAARPKADRLVDALATATTLAEIRAAAAALK